ncbi:hypothetical protein HQ576_14635 [bacterium]|nr:hypothetical protein [bacterium]
MLAVARLDGTVSDLDADEDGNVYVTGGFGSAELKPTLETVWTSEIGDEAARIAAGPDGRAIVLSRESITVINRGGQPSVGR